MTTIFSCYLFSNICLISSKSVDRATARLQSSNTSFSTIDKSNIICYFVGRGSNIGGPLLLPQGPVQFGTGIQVVSSSEGTTFSLSTSTTFTFYFTFLFTMALLKFFPRTTRTRIITSHLLALIMSLAVFND